MQPIPELRVGPLLIAHVVIYAGLLGAAGLPLRAEVVVASAVLAALLIAASVVDLRQQIIPDWASLGLVLAGLLATYRFAPGDLGLHAVTGLGWFVGLAVISEGYFRWRGIDGFGLGDAKLMAAAGAWLGPAGSLSVLAMASTAAVLAILGTAAMRGRALSGKTGIPFGPFIVLSIWIVWLYGAFL